jgi:hypothetical protein
MEKLCCGQPAHANERTLDDLTALKFGGNALHNISQRPRLMLDKVIFGRLLVNRNAYLKEKIK